MVDGARYNRITLLLSVQNLRLFLSRLHVDPESGNEGAVKRQLPELIESLKLGNIWVLVQLIFLVLVGL